MRVILQRAADDRRSDMTALALVALAALPCGEPLVDARDGRTYATVRIGEQCWMARNLDHGTVVPDGLPRDASALEKSCYANDPESCRVYGGLYSWDEARAACPAGWHLPTRGEWETLAARLGTAVAGEKLKARKDHVPAFDGTDEAGFTALPAGTVYRCSFGRQGHWAVFWTATESGPERAVSATPIASGVAPHATAAVRHVYLRRTVFGEVPRTLGSRATVTPGRGFRGIIRAGGTLSGQKRTKCTAFLISRTKPEHCGLS
jgi:uncharacterized protein (TIGR02145 family)